MIKKDIIDLEHYIRYKETIPRQKKILKELEKDLEETLELLADIGEDYKNGNLTEKEYMVVIGHLQGKAENTDKIRRDQEDNLKYCEEFNSTYEEKQQQESDQSFKN